MPQVIIKGLAQYGTITDIPSFETPVNAWTEVLNCSFINGGIAKSNTRVEVLTPALDTVSKMYTKNGFVFYGTKNKIYRATQYESMDVSRISSTYVDSNQWFITELSNVLIFTNDSNIPQMFKPTDTKFSDLTGWDANWRTSKIRAFKNFLIAVGTTENGVDYPQRIRWSDLALPNTVPTSWNATDTTKSAGFNDLSEAKGNITDIVQFGDVMVIYTTREVYLMTYVGGNDIFTFRKIFDDISMLSTECAAQINGGHFVVTSSDVVVHNGSSWKSVIQDKIKQQLFNIIQNSDINTVKVQNYPAKQEVWVLYSSTFTAGVLDRAAIYSITNDNWTFRDIPNATAIAYGILPSDDDLIYNFQDYTYDSDSNTFNGIGQDFVRNSLFIVTDDLKWWAVDEGTTGTINLPSTAIKQNIDFDDYGLEATSHKMIKSIYPQIQGTGSVFISIGVAESAFDPPMWSNAVEFNISTDRKADFRVSGRYISIRFQSFDQDFWNMTSYGIDVVPRGTK